jgi:aminoglycoside phosphotransferase (APT) family kinase protein
MPDRIDALPDEAEHQPFSGWDFSWLEGRLDSEALPATTRLVELEAAAPAAVEGQTLLHLDVRSDNVLLTEDRVYIVDWPWASIGAPWVEPLCFAPSVEMQGGPSAPEVFGRSKAAAGADRDAVAAALAAVGGMLVHHGGLPPPPGLPTLRGFQAAQGEVAIRWLRELLDRRHRGP